MISGAPENPAFAELGRCVEALGRYRLNLVLSGGLVPLLYRYLPELRGAYALDPIHTFDIDWTVPNRLDNTAPFLHDMLLEAGFHVVMAGETKPPVCRYHAGSSVSPLSPVHIEFLTPRIGSSLVRGHDRRTVSVQTGLSAQALPYLQLLLYAPIPIEVSSIPLLAADPGTCLLLPNPVSFIVQKTLARAYRRPHKRPGDQTHIFDVVLLWRSRWAEMAAWLSEMEESSGFPAKWFAKARTTLCELYLTANGEGPTEVASVYNSLYTHTVINESTVRERMRQFLSSIGWA